MKPTMTPDAIAITTAKYWTISPARAGDSQLVSLTAKRLAINPGPSLKITAKTKPENPRIAGKQRSISPAPMIKVRPTASRITGGSVDKKVVY